MVGEGDVDVLSAASDIMNAVRAESARLGVIQTPVVLGSVQGGLLLPQLRPGAAFRAAFPEYSDVRISSDMHDLVRLGIPEPVANAWSQKYSQGLNALQLEAVNEFRITEGNSLVVVAPTSAGKTFVGEIAAARAITEGRKTVFLLPYRALVNEKYDQFSALYSGVLGLRVACTGLRELSSGSPWAASGDGSARASPGGRFVWRLCCAPPSTCRRHRVP
jgi:helicase